MQQKFRKINVTDESQLMDFMKCIKTGLKYGLEAYSLELVELELYHRNKIVVNIDQSKTWVIRAIVRNPSTMQVKSSETVFDGHIGETEVEDVAPMVQDMVLKLKQAFYG